MSHTPTPPLSFVQRISSWFGAGLQRLIPPDTRLSTWARRLKTYDEVPEASRPFLDGLLLDRSGPFPYLVITPTFKGVGRHLEHEKLVCLTDESMHVVEHREGRISSTALPLHGACIVERGVVLLHSWITVRASNADVVAPPATLRFNSVTDHLMAPFIDALRAKPSGIASVDLQTERERLNYLAQTHYKFYSYGRLCLRPGDRLFRVLLQPEIRGDQLTLFGFSVFRRPSPAHLTILTDSELILIRDDETQFWLRGPAPGAIWTYVPRNLITGASLASAESGRITLTIQTSVRRELHALFDAPLRPELERLVESLRS